MKWFFWTFAGLNFLLIAWGLMTSQQVGRPVQSTVKGVPTIHLASELEREKRSASREKTKVIEEVFQAEKEPVTVVLGDEKGVAEPEVMTSESPAQKPVEASVSAELDEEVGISASEAGPEADTAPQTNVSACMTYGPLSSELEASQVATDLIKFGVRPDIRKILFEVPSSYWVYLPSRDSIEEALRMEEEVREKGITDIRVVRSGEHAAAISLGLYRNKDAAERRVIRIQKLGYKPKMDSRYRQENEYWVDFQVATGAVSDWGDGFWQVMERTYPDAIREERECPEKSLAEEKNTLDSSE